MNINVKFKTQQDYQSVLQLSKYVGMTPRQFARTAVLKQTQELVAEINRLIAAAKEAKLQAGENANVGEPSAPVDSAASETSHLGSSPSPS